MLFHVLTADDVKPAYQLLHRLSSLQGQAAEVLYILRPLIYALLMQRVARTYGYEGHKWKKNWTPWLAGIGMEYLSRQLAKRDLAAKCPGGAGSELEREELKKRGMSLAWWGMRGAFYENVTRGYIRGTADIVKKVPLLGGIVAGVVEDYDWLWREYYFSTSTL